MEPPPDEKWGGPLKNGSVTGMIGMAHRHDAHFSIDEITVTGKGFFFNFSK